jgi:hypothetical protein
MVGRRVVRDGDAALGHHDDRDNGAGRDGRPALHPVLLRIAARDGDPGRDARTVPAWREGLYRLRVPRATLQSGDALADRVPVSRLTRDVLRCDRLRAGRGVLRDLRLEDLVGRRPHRCAHGHLHHDRRRARHRLGGRQADGAHRDGVVRRGDHAAREAAGGPNGRDGNRRCPGPPSHLRLLVQSHEHLHVLVGCHRRDVSDALLLRNGPESGPAVPHRPVGRRGAQLAAHERLRPTKPPCAPRTRIITR